MFPRGRGKRVAVFVGLYLLVAVPPYLALNWQVVRRVVTESVPPDPLTAVGLSVAAIALFGALVYGSDGVDRYVQFLLAPTDWLSILVGLSFLVAAATWWTVPELILSYFGRIDLSILYFLVFLGHVPMLLFLSLLAAAGFAQEAG